MTAPIPRTPQAIQNILVSKLGVAQSRIVLEALEKYVFAREEQCWRNCRIVDGSDSSRHWFESFKDYCNSEEYKKVWE
jgi:hypothetical protein